MTTLSSLNSFLSYFVDTHISTNQASAKPSSFTKKTKKHYVRRKNSHLSLLTKETKETKERTEHGAVSWSEPMNATRSAQPRGALPVTTEFNRRSWQPHLASIVRDYRHRQGRSLRDVSTRAGISFGYLGQLERNERTPSIVVARSLSEALDLTSADASALDSGALRGVGKDYREGRKPRG